MFKRKRNLIGFSGPMCSGKTTAARVLVKDAKAFATPLKDCLERLFKFDCDQLYTFEGKNKIDSRYGVSPRTVMQNFGTEFIRGTVPDLWLILMAQELDNTPDHQLVVIDDCRFENELQFVRDQGGLLSTSSGEGQWPVSINLRLCWRCMRMISPSLMPLMLKVLRSK